MSEEGVLLRRVVLQCLSNWRNPFAMHMNLEPLAVV